MIFYRDNTIVIKNIIITTTQQQPTAVHPIKHIASDLPTSSQPQQQQDRLCA